ncbi:arsenate reductase/protein-tyrosine-phosphatase family protein [Arthrobacter rhombi]|uniref:arsenate reductase/protein-tyrosine-phosphatase family protein n=1 Tax=Arthrobacter rhombi TaxID=71253 RepID=UPI003566BC69
MSRHQSGRGPISTLVVCTANICRSPTAGFALSQFPFLSVQSAGIRASSGEGICSSAAVRIRDFPGGADYVDSFVSRPINFFNVSDFELILTATSSIRGALVQKYPEIRDRTFTLIESKLLAASRLEDQETSILTHDGPSSVLSHRRGTLPTPAPRKRWFGGTDAPPMDLADTHGIQRPRRHTGTVSKALDVGNQLGTSLGHWNLLHD